MHKKSHILVRDLIFHNFTGEEENVILFSLDFLGVDNLWYFSESIFQSIFQSLFFANDYSPSIIRQLLFTLDYSPAIIRQLLETLTLSRFGYVVTRYMTSFINIIKTNKRAYKKHHS